MVQPIQYQIPGVSPDPFAGVLQGLRLGATLQELDLARAAQQQKLAQQQAQAEQQRQANEAMSAYLAKPSGQRTLEDTRGLIRFLPAEQVKNLIDIDSRLSEDQRRNQVLFAGQVGSALRLGNTDVALQMVRQRAEAETDPMKKQGFQILAQSIEKAPEAALETLRVSTTALGKDYEPAAKAMFGAPAAGFKVLTEPEAKARNLPTDRGQVWQLNAETGQVTALQAGEKPKDQFVTVDAKKLAEQFGITGVEPGIYKVNTATNEVTAVGRGGTTVNMKTEGPPPPGYQYERDTQGNVISMRPIPGGPADTKAAEQKAASKALSNINYNPETGEDDISRLIARSTSGGAQALTADVLRYINVTTEGAKAINALQSAANQITTDMLGGRLGAGISNTDREFILATLGDVGNPNKTARERLSGWTRAKERMVKAGMLPMATPSSPPTSAEASPVSTPAVSTRALPNQAAIDFLRRNPSLRGAFDEKYGPGAAARVLGGQ